MIGSLLQPTCHLSWGDVQLMPYEADGVLQHLAHSINVNLSKDSTVPKLTFEILATPVGFELFQRLKAESLDKPIVVRFGYPEGSSISWTFKFSGMSLGTGKTPALKITAVGILKGCWTSSKLSFTMENAVSLAEFPAYVAKMAGDCAKDITFQFTGTAAEAAKKIQIKSNFNQVTPHVILTGILRQSGMVAQVGDSAMGGGLVVISSAPAYENELVVDRPKLITGLQPATPGIRSLWVIGPSAIQQIERSQDFSTGTQSSDLNSSTTRPVSPETNAPNVVQPNSTPQENVAEQQQPAGVRGPSNPGSDATGTPVGEGSEADKRKAALAKMLQTSVTMSLLYFPRYAAGIRPRDIICVPSLASGPDRYVEDFEVTNISYSLARNGGITMAITGARPFTGEANMLDESSIQQVRAIADDMQSLEDWSSWLWLGNGTVGRAPALAN